MFPDTRQVRVGNRLVPAVTCLHRLLQQVNGLVGTRAVVRLGRHESGYTGRCVQRRSSSWLLLQTLIDVLDSLLETPGPSQEDGPVTACFNVTRIYRQCPVVIL